MTEEPEDWDESVHGPCGGGGGGRFTGPRVREVQTWPWWKLYRPSEHQWFLGPQWCRLEVMWDPHLLRMRDISLRVSGEPDIGWFARATVSLRPNNLHASVSWYPRRAEEKRS